MYFTFHNIYKEYTHRLIWFSDKIINSRVEAEDIVNEVMTKLWQSFDGFNDEIAVKQWLYKAVRNSSIDYLRRADRIIRHRNESYYLSEEGETDILHAMYEAEILTELMKSVKSLPKTDQEIFNLLYFEGMDNEGVAKTLNLSVKTVRNRKAVLVDSLRFMLKERKQNLTI